MKRVSDLKMKQSRRDGSDDERTKEIQKYLIKHLQLTPRRRLFEEQQRAVSVELLVDEEPASPTVSPTNDFDFHIINELNEFRQKHPSECMSDSNRQRFQRAREKEEKFLSHPCAHHYISDGRLFPKPTNGTVQDLLKNQRKEKELNDESHPRMVQYPPDKSLALTHQKFKR